MSGGGKKKGPRKSSQNDQGAPDKNLSEADVIFELMDNGSRIGRRGWNEGVMGKMLELDDDETQDMVRRLRSSILVSAGTDREQALEGLKRLLHERKQSMKTLQEDSARRGGERDRGANDKDRRKWRDKQNKKKRRESRNNSDGDKKKR